MERRKFIHIMGLGLATTAFSPALISCSDLNEYAEYGWDESSFEQNDLRLKLIAYAMLCPNPHNIQPWLIKMTSANRFELYIDSSRLLPETDPFARQIHIGQGTFLETLSIAATGHGYKAEINYFPQGEYSNKEVVEKPIASIYLIKQQKAKIDPLFSQLLKRQSNKREYDNSLLTAAEKSQLNTLYTLPHSDEITAKLQFIDNHKDVRYVQQALTDAMVIEVSSKQRDLETIHMFRFNEQELALFRDGFGLAHSGVTGVKKIIAENFFMSRANSEKDTADFGQQSVTFTEKVSQSTSSFAILTSMGNSRLQQVKIGREYCRLNLSSSAIGLAQHPMSQVLQEYQDMLPLQAAFKSYFNVAEEQTIQMLVRLGRAKRVEHTPRRTVNSIIL